MNTTRWLSVMLFAGVLALNGLSLTSVFSHDEKPADPKAAEAKIKTAMAKLSEADRTVAAAQRFCPMMETARLGAMGTPIKIMIDGKSVFVCCEHCKDDAVDGGKATLAKVEKLKKAAAAIAKLPAADQPLAEAQLFCPINEGSRLGSMGTPMKVMLEGKPVFLCCKGCEDAARENAKTTLAKVDEIKKANTKAAHHDGDGHDHKHGAADHDNKKGSTAKKK